MAKSEARYLPQKFRRTNPVTISNTAAPGVLVVSPAGTDPSELVSLSFSGDTGAGKTLEIYLADTSGGTNPELLWTGTLSANEGLTVGTPFRDWVQERRLRGVDIDKGVFLLPNGRSIYARITTAATGTAPGAVAVIKDYEA